MKRWDWLGLLAGAGWDFRLGSGGVAERLIPTTPASHYVGNILQIPWYNALGNHDYGKNPGCQTEYESPNNDRWVMPDRYYTQRIPINDAGTQHVTMIVLDTNPCIKDYRGDSPLYWVR